MYNNNSFNELQPGNRAYGELNCPNAQESDQGAYSCEAINSKGSCFAGSTGCGQPGQVHLAEFNDVFYVYKKCDVSIFDIH